MSILNEGTLGRIQDCKTPGFPQCLEASLFKIFRFSEQQGLIENLVKKLELEQRGDQRSTEEQIWTLYDQVLRELGRELGPDVSQVIEFQSLVEMETMGCMLCPLYQGEVIQIQGR